MLGEFGRDCSCGAFGVLPALAVRGARRGAFAGRDDLIRNKRASARIQDLAAVEALEAIAAAK
jgi:hypothetical protein